MKKYMKKSWNKEFVINIIKYLPIFLIPWQVYLNKGISVTLYLISLAIYSLWFLREISKISLKSFLLKNKKIILIYLISVAFVLCSAVVNWYVFEVFSLTAVLKWIVFFSEFILFYFSFKLKFWTKKSAFYTFGVSILLMSVFSLYQPFINSLTERNIMHSVEIYFNDYDLVTSYFENPHKFNWEYKGLVRAHGVIVNAGHFTMLISLTLLTLLFLQKREKRSARWILIFLSTVLWLSLVRSSILALFFVLLYLLFVDRKRGILLAQSLLLGLLLSFFIAFLTPNHIFVYALVVRLVEWITLDGLWLPKLQQGISFAYDKLSWNARGFDELGGVGGRFKLVKIFFEYLFLPNIKRMHIWLLGFGPGNFHSLVSSIIKANSEFSYFKRFGGVDSSWISNFISLGLTPFIMLLYAFLKFKNEILANKYLTSIFIFLAVQLSFLDVLPNLRLGAAIALFVSLAWFYNEKEF